VGWFVVISVHLKVTCSNNDQMIDECNILNCKVVDQMIDECNVLKCKVVDGLMSVTY